MAFLSPAFSGDLVHFESRHTRAAFIPSTFYSPPILPTFYNSSFTNFIDFASSRHAPRYAVSKMEKEQPHPQSKQIANTTNVASTSKAISSSSGSPSSSSSGAGCSSSSSSSSSVLSSPSPSSTRQSCSKSFSIDSILGRTGSKHSETNSNAETAHQELEKDDTTPKPNSQSDNPDDPMTRFSWLQCTRYKPPRLPRIKKKEGTKKRKLGRNPRVPFSAAQVAMLEQKFRRTHYLSSVDVAELSTALNLSENRVKIWFQNRRARERRDREVMEKNGVGGIAWTAGPSTSGNPGSQFSQAVQEGTSAFTPVSYSY